MTNNVQTCGGVELVALTPAMAPAVAAAAAADGHRLIVPTHAVLKGGEVVGYGSLGRVPLFFAWMDRRRATGADSFRAWRLAEEEMRRQGHRMIVMPCEAKSPFSPFLTRKGYEILGEAQVTIKEL